MLSQITYDYYRISKQKSIIIAPIIMFILALISLLTIYFVMQTINSAEFPEITAELLDSQGYTGRAFLYQATSNMNLPLFIAIISSIFVAGSFANGSVKTAVSRGSGKINVYLSMLLSISTVTIALTAFCFLASGILVPIIGYGRAFTSAEFGAVMARFGMQLLVALGYASLFTFLSSLIRTTGGSVAMNLATFIIASIITSVMLVVGINSNLAWCIDAKRAFLTSAMSSACSLNPSKTDYLCATLVPLAYVAVSTALGSLAMWKRDVK